MKKLLVATFAVLAFAPISAFAAGENNIGSCGWGTKLFSGQRGIAPQVFGATTNGTSGNQTFAISSGTSGCTQDGLVTSNWKTAAYIDSNKTQFARDTAKGSGDTIASLGRILKVDSSHQDLFAATLKDNFDRIFTDVNVSTDDIVLSLREILSENAELSVYAGNV